MAKTATRSRRTSSKSRGAAVADELNLSTESEEEAGASTAPDQEPTDPGSADVPADDVAGGDEVDEESAAEESGQVEAIAEAASPFDLERLTELGFEDLTPEDAPTRIVEAYANQQAELDSLRQQMAGMQQLQEMQREQLQASQAATPAADEATDGVPWVTHPALDFGAINQYRQVGSDGEVVWAADTPPGLQEQLAEYNQSVSGWADGLMYAPQETLAPLIRYEAQQMLQEVLGFPVAELPQRMDMGGERSFAAKVHDDYGERLYEIDPVTKQLDTNRLTPFGETINRLMGEAQELGIGDWANQWKYALRIAEASEAGAAGEQSTKRETARQERDEKKRQHRRRTRTQDRSGSIDPPAQETKLRQNPTQTRAEDVADMLNL